MSTKRQQFFFSKYVFLLLLSLLWFLLDVSQGVHVFDVYRMFQFEKGGVAYGSQKAGVNLLATAGNANDASQQQTNGDEENNYGRNKTEDLGRKVVVYPLEQLTLDKLTRLLNSRLDGLLILVPPRDQKQSTEVVQEWSLCEVELAKQKIPFAVYFAYRDEVPEQFYENLVRFSADSASSVYRDNYHLVTSISDPTPVESVSITNFQAWLPGGGINEDENSPTIAIVAHYDTFGIAPAMVTGADANGSGVLAVLELLRLFSKLYQASRTQGSYNLLFLLTAGGQLNYLGSKQFLQTAEPRLLNSIEFVLCLDSIASSDPEEPIRLHLSRLPKDPKFIQLYQDFNDTAQMMNVPFEIVRKKINVSNTEVSWEHEHYSKKRILAATLSNRAFPRSTSFSNIFDVRAQVNASLLERNIKFIAESLAKHIYNFHNKDLVVFEGSTSSVNHDFVSSWFDAINTYSRGAPLLSSKSPLLSALQRVLAGYVNEGDVSVQTFPVDAEYKFYGSLKTSMSSYLVKPFVFEIILSGCIGAYLLLLHIILKGREFFTQTKSFFVSLFAKKKTKNSRN